MALPFDDFCNLLTMIRKILSYSLLKMRLLKLCLISENRDPSEMLFYLFTNLLIALYFFEVF